MTDNRKRWMAYHMDNDNLNRLRYHLDIQAMKKKRKLFTITREEVIAWIIFALLFAWIFLK